MVSTLPAMPANYHGWWKDAKTERIKLEPQKVCDHASKSGHTSFELTDEGARCTKCNLGFLGEGFEIRDGKLCNSKMSAH